MSEKFCLKWNGFQTNVTKSFSALRNEDEFFDVTLVGDDNIHASAHKVVLSACSDFFKSILKQTKHSHPMLCLEGINSQEMNNVLDYIYNGEVEIFQEKLDRFLEVASRFQLEGLIGNEKAPDMSKTEEIELEESDVYVEPKPQNIQDTTMKTNTDYTKSMVSINGSQLTDISELDGLIGDLLEKQVNCYLCKPCGKILKNKGHAFEHAETHIDGLSYECQQCNKTFR